MKKPEKTPVETIFAAAAAAGVKFAFDESRLKPILEGASLETEKILEAIFGNAPPKAIFMFAHQNGVSLARVNETYADMIKAGGKPSPQWESACAKAGLHTFEKEEYPQER